jgi:hypothetical protein
LWGTAKRFSGIGEERFERVEVPSRERARIDVDTILSAFTTEDTGCGSCPG